MQQTPKVIEGAKPIASATMETITSSDPSVIVVSAGALILAYLLLPPIWSVVTFNFRGYKGTSLRSIHNPSFFCGFFLFQFFFAALFLSLKMVMSYNVGATIYILNFNHRSVGNSFELKTNRTESTLSNLNATKKNKERKKEAENVKKEIVMDSDG